MGSKVNPVAIGLFVVGALGLVVAGLLVLSRGTFFTKKFQYVLFFDGSVQGLNNGAPVLFRGVQVGKVTDIAAVYDPKKTEIGIQVFIEIAGGSVKVTDGRGLDPRREIKSLIDRGLRAQLQMQSFVTGLLFIDLDLHPDSPLQLHGDGGDIPELPTVPSTLEQVAATARKAMSELGKLPLKDVVNDLRSIFQSLNKILQLPEIRSTLVGLNNVLGNATEVLQETDRALPSLSQKAEGLIGEARAAMVELRQLIRTVDRQVKPLGDSVQGLSKTAQSTLEQAQKTLTRTDAQVINNAQRALVQLRKTLAAYEGVVATDSDLFRSLDQLLQELTDAARSIRLLANYLERNPNALIRGKSRPGGR